MTANHPRSPILTLYRFGTSVAGPIAGLLLRERARRGKEDLDRLHERFGAPHRARPAGPLVWIHAASVGESISVLPLVRAVLAERDDVHVLVTTGTVTSARVMAERLPLRAFHQYVPVDLLSSVEGFLNHWRPDLAIWIESELWPNMILATAAREIPMALVSARLSETSYRSWTRAPAAAKVLLNSFTMLLPQDEAVSRRLKSLGANSVRVPSNLKLWAEPLPFDPASFELLKSTIGSRPVWLAASTHEGEEVAVAKIHTALAAQLPDLLTIIVPRHPKRGNEICTTLRQDRYAVAQRSRGDSPTAKTDIYVADTLGEMGLFYRLARVVFIGKSLIGHGGQNPLEPARLGCAVVSGPHVGNFEPIFDLLAQAKAVEILANSEQLQRSILNLLTHPEQARQMGLRAETIAGDPASLNRTFDELRPLLKGLPIDARS